MTDMLDGAAVKEIAELAGLAGADIHILHLKEAMPGVPISAPALLNPRTGEIKGVANVFEAYRTHPARKIGTARVETMASFIDLTNRHKTEHSALFGAADWRKPGLTAVIDYHKADQSRQADWANHKINYEFPLTEEWGAWLAINGKPMDQADFAEWIEAHIAECTTPTTEEIARFEALFSAKLAAPHQLITLSRGLQIYAETKVGKAVTLQTGETSITFEETHRDAAGNAISVPGLFMISIAPFFGGAPARIPVRLRYKLKGGSIVWTLLLYRPDLAITSHIELAMAAATAGTALPLYLGAPEK